LSARPSARPKSLVVTARKITELEGLAEKFCDDFVCSSSPALEPTVRTLARDIENEVDGSRTMRCYGNEVEYTDPMRSFTGRDKYEGMNFISENVQNAKAYITGVDLEGIDLVIITYTLKGDTPAGGLDMDFTERYKLNVISGRVVEHEVEWSMGRTGAPASAYFLASRTAFMAGQGASDLGKTFDEALDGLSPQNEPYQGDPADPLKFFQQDDNRYNDMFMFAAGVTMLYAVVQVLLLVT